MVILKRRAAGQAIKQATKQAIAGARAIPNCGEANLYVRFATGFFRRQLACRSLRTIEHSSHAQVEVVSPMPGCRNHPRPRAAAPHCLGERHPNLKLSGRNNYLIDGVAGLDREGPGGGIRCLFLMEGIVLVDGWRLPQFSY